MERFTITYEVSMFAHDQADAEHLARLIHERVTGITGGGQTIVRTKSVAPDTETFNHTR